MATDTIKWIEIYKKVLNTINWQQIIINWIKMLLKQFDPINF